MLKFEKSNSCLLCPSFPSGKFQNELMRRPFLDSLILSHLLIEQHTLPTLKRTLHCTVGGFQFCSTVLRSTVLLCYKYSIAGLRARAAFPMVTPR